MEQWMGETGERENMGRTADTRNHVKNHTEAYYDRTFLNIYTDERNLNGVIKKSRRPYSD